MGKKLGVKDYTKSQSFSDAEAANVIKNGKGKMKAYKQAVRCRCKSVGCLRPFVEEITPIICGELLLTGVGEKPQPRRDKALFTSQLFYNCELNLDRGLRFRLRFSDF